MLFAKSAALAQAEIAESNIASSGICLRFLRYGLPCLSLIQVYSSFAPNLKPYFIPTLLWLLPLLQ